MNHEQALSVEQLAATVAHEIRNPLSLIKANIQLIELDDASDHHKKRYRLIYSELDKVSDLLQNFMHLLKPVAYQFETTSLPELTDEVIDLFDASANYTIALESTPGLPHVLCDKKMVKQVLINIMQNSVEAFTHPNGFIKVNIYPDGKYIAISIRDNGPGFDNGILSQIYTPFFTTKENGHGIGLFLCKKIIEEHNGSFTITSVKNQGTTVTLAFPL